MSARMRTFHQIAKKLSKALTFFFGGSKSPQLILKANSQKSIYNDRGQDNRITWPPFSGYSEGYSSAGSYLHEQLSAKENKVIQLNGEVAELRRKVFDLEEALSEKDQVRAMISFSVYN